MSITHKLWISYSMLDRNVNLVDGNPIKTKADSCHCYTPQASLPYIDQGDAHRTIHVLRSKLKTGLTNKGALSWSLCQLALVNNPLHLDRILDGSRQIIRPILGDDNIVLDPVQDQC